MKNSLSYLFILATFIFSACSEDNALDDDEVNQTSSATLTGNISYDGTTIDILHGIIFDRGILSSGYAYNFWISDDRLDLPIEEPLGEIAISLTLTKRDGTAFSEGTFEIRRDGFEPEDIATIDIYTSSGTTDGESGSVVVEGSGTEFTLTLDFVTEDGKTITGTVSGDFPISVFD